MSPLTLHAERCSAAIDGVGSNELGTTTRAGKSRSPVRLELFDEAPAFATRVAIITEARSARFDRFLEDADDGIAKESRFFHRHR
jgi:hypothetical protein